MFVQDANDQSAARPCFVPRDSDMHRALVDQPVSRRGIPFNPWTLLLELLDDPRVAYDGSPEASRCILSAIAWMGGVTPHNMLKRRDELVRALLKAKCIRFDPKLSTGAPGNVELGSAQLMQLYQIQWPRFIAEKYRQSMSVPS
ncbi:hypothetical protein GGF43_006992 [Coemansia sp. RSA 2618]|nr:hypothetical protein GGF43_006992 [Coemansia sp. RSA 2618]